MRQLKAICTIRLWDFKIQDDGVQSRQQVLAAAAASVTGVVLNEGRWYDELGSDLSRHD